jgi:putative membrane protein
MKFLVPLVATVFLGVSLSVYPQQKNEKNGANTDARAMRELAEANMAEVEAGKVAAQKAQSEEVKKFAQHMVDDHGKMLQEVQQLAQSKGVDLPKSPSKKHQAAMKKLESASGEQFDKAYMSEMVKDHRETVKKVEKIAKSSKDAEVKGAAEKALPDIKEHLQMAQELSGKTGGGASKGSSSQGSSSKSSSSQDSSATGSSSSK